MIFLGDLACPPIKAVDFNNSVEKLGIFDGEVAVVNLEAVILSGRKPIMATLFNHESVLDSLQKKAKKVIVSLANNHMYDYPVEIMQTKSFLENRGVGVFGLQNTDGSFDPYEFEDEDGYYAFFGHCWNLYSATNPNRVNDVKIVDCGYDVFLKVVKLYIEANPHRKVFCFMHWNYDLELLPFPMHVKLSHDLIDSGVEGVIGSHSHVTHLVEEYKGKIIAYCLGNFYLPSGIYFNGQLNYPDESKNTIGIRIRKGRTDVLRFETDKSEPIKFKDSVSPSAFAPFATSDIKAYTKLFRKRRAKRLFVPVFDSYSGISYGMKNLWAISRVKLIKQILKILHK